MLPASWATILAFWLCLTFLSGSCMSRVREGGGGCLFFVCFFFFFPGSRVFCGFGSAFSFVSTFVDGRSGALGQ